MRDIKLVVTTRPMKEIPEDEDITDCTRFADAVTKVSNARITCKNLIAQ